MAITKTKQRKKKRKKEARKAAAANKDSSKADAKQEDMKLGARVEMSKDTYQLKSFSYTSFHR